PRCPEQASLDGWRRRSARWPPQRGQRGYRAVCSHPYDLIHRYQGLGLDRRDGSPIQPIYQRLHRSVHHSQEGAWIEANPENHHGQGCRNEDFAGLQIRDGILDGLAERSQHRPFVVPEKIGSAKDYAAYRYSPIEPIGFEGPHENEEFTDEAIGSGQTNTRQSNEQEIACEERGPFGHAAE